MHDKTEVPPKLYLSYDNTVLANSSYHKDREYETDYGEDKYVAENENISVTCLAEGAKPEANITWVVNGKIIDNVPQNTTPNIQENRTFDSISTLQFSPKGETVTVICNASLGETDINASVNVTFLTYVKPHVFFLLNGIRILINEVYVAEGERVNIVCCAEGARPSANLTWQRDDTNFNSSSQTTQDVANHTFNTYIPLTISPERDKTTLTCISSLLEEINVTETVTLDVFTYVLREPSITFNGKSYDVISVNTGDSVTLICNAAGTRPNANLTWKVNGFIPQEPRSKVSQSSDLSSLIFQPEDKDLVECISYVTGPNITREVNVTFQVNDTRNTEDPASSYSIINVIIPVVAVALSIVLVPCVCIAVLRLKRSQSSNLSTNLSIPMEETSNVTQPKNAQKEYEEDVNKAFPKPPDLELPQIPEDSEMAYYSDLEQENAYEVHFHTEYYSAMGKSVAKGKMFCEKDICFILNMKMGHIYDRWMGTIDVNPTDKKCVIFTTVSGSLEKNDIRWDKFVKRVLELPEKTSLTKVEGIGINEGKLYLIHEHMACQTLDERITDPMSRTEVMEHLVGIIEGVEVIQSFGLVHPGLSTKKVLLTKQGVCKLYDFCLSEDASNIVRIKKSKITCTLNQLAPEALLRDKYTKASDTWSLATLIWEILSCGSPPFPNEEQSPEREKAVYNIPETWPSHYKILRNKLLFECWNQDTSLRPPTLQLKSSFTESFEALDTYGPSLDDLASSYVHMKGIEKMSNDT